MRNLARKMPCKADVSVCAILITLALACLADAQTSLSEPPECAQECVYHCSRFYGIPVEMKDILAKMPPSAEGNSFALMRDTLLWIGLRSEGRRMTLDELRSATLPVIAHWANHFVVVERVEGGILHVRDGTGRRRVMSAEFFGQNWDGNVLVVFVPSVESFLPAYMDKPAPNTPRIRFGTLALDAGELESNLEKPLEFTFPFSNQGSGDLRIGTVRTTCRCAVGSKPESPVAPRQNGKITVKYDTLGIKGPFETGVYVQTSDPLLPVIALTVAGFIGPPLTATPGRLKLGEAGKDTGVSARIFLNYFGDEPLNLSVGKSEIVQSAEIIAVTKENARRWVPESVKPEKRDISGRYVIEARLSLAHLSLGRQSGSINIQTGLAKYPSLDIPFEVTAVAPAETTPRVLFLGVLSPGCTVRDTLHMRLRSGAEFRVTGVRTDMNGVACEYPEQTAREIPLSLFYAAGSSIETSNSTLTVEYVQAEESEKETLTIPIRGYAAASSAAESNPSPESESK